MDSSTNKTGHHDIIEIMLKVVLHIIQSINQYTLCIILHVIFTEMTMHIHTNVQVHAVILRIPIHVFTE